MAVPEAIEDLISALDPILSTQITKPDAPSSKQEDLACIAIQGHTETLNKTSELPVVESENVKRGWEEIINWKFPLVQAKVMAKQKFEEAACTVESMKTALVKEQAAHINAETKLTSLMAKIEEDARRQEAEDAARTACQKEDEIRRKREQQKKEQD